MEEVGSSVGRQARAQGVEEVPENGGGGGGGEYITRGEVVRDPVGKKVQANWVRTNQGTEELPEVRYRHVAQELGDGERLDELFAGTPSLTMLSLSVAAER